MVLVPGTEIHFLVQGGHFNPLRVSDGKVLWVHLILTEHGLLNNWKSNISECT